MTIGEIITATVPYLEKRGVADARLATEYLAARVMRCKRLELPARLHETPEETRVEAMRRGVARLAAGEPVQYVLGRWDFRGITLKTDRRALIPRTETEQLVQLLLDDGIMSSCDTPRVLDYGTGSGCIALAVAAEAPHAKVAGIDTSAEAIALAMENAEALGLADRVSFVNTSETDIADVFDAQSFEAIVSNPPYISSDACNRLPVSVRDFEPRIALDGGPDGMYLLRAVIEDASTLLVSGGMIFLETSFEERQQAPISRFLENSGFEDVRISKDLSGAPRLISARLASGL